LVRSERAHPGARAGDDIDAATRDTELTLAVAAAAGTLARGPDHMQQRRKIEFAATLTGVAPVLDEATRVRVAEVLCVPTVELVEHARALRKGVARDLGSWGRAIVAVLRGVLTRSAFFDRLCAAGSIVGLWGLPHRVESANGRLIVTFPSPGMPCSRPTKPVLCSHECAEGGIRRIDVSSRGALG
jgi:hypothetical protein